MTALTHDQRRELRRLQALNPAIKGNGPRWDLMLYTAILLTIPTTCRMLTDKYTSMVKIEQAKVPDFKLNIG